MNLHDVYQPPRNLFWVRSSGAHTEANRVLGTGSNAVFCECEHCEYPAPRHYFDSVTTNYTNICRYCTDGDHPIPPVDL